MTSIGVSEIINSNSAGITINSGTSIFFDTGGNNRMTILPGGSIGIGTISPQYDLDLGNGGVTRSGAVHFFNDSLKITTSANTLDYHSNQIHNFYYGGNLSMSIFNDLVGIRSLGVVA